LCPAALRFRRWAKRGETMGNETAAEYESLAQSRILRGFAGLSENLLPRVLLFREQKTIMLLVGRKS
jgi:uracil DNA glycosylase